MIVGRPLRELPCLLCHRLGQTLAVLLAALLCWAGAVPANAAPAEPPVLTVKGRISKAGLGAQMTLTMSQLAALPQHSFTTHTPWDTQPRRFTGPLLRDVLRLVGAQGDELLAVALNDYKVTIPTSDTTRFGVILARLIDGKPMPVRDRGPLFIVYPYDSDAELRSDRYYARSAWQLLRIEVR